MSRTNQKAVRRLVVAAVTVAAIVTVLTFLGRVNWFFELFTHFRLQLAGTAIAVAAIAVLLRMPASALCLLAIAVVHLSYVRAYVWPGTSSVQARPLTIRVMSANVSRRNSNFALLNNLIAETKPDIVGLIEVNERWLAALEDLDYPYHILRPREDAFGLAILSRYPLLESERSPYTYDGTQTAIMAQLEIDEQATHILLTHVMAPMTPSQAAARNRQLSALSAIFRDNRDKPGLLIGDLNITPWSPYYGMLETDTGLVNAARGKGYLPTWPENPAFMRIPIDHCLVTQQFAVEGIRTGPDIGSDHLPLIVDITLADTVALRH